MMWALLGWRIKDRQDHMAMLELPISQLTFFTYNMNRHPGDEKNGIAPAPLRPPDDFRLFKRGKKGGESLVTKDVANGDYSLLGAVADRSKFTAWVDGRQGKGGKQVSKSVARKRR